MNPTVSDSSTCRPPPSGGTTADAQKNETSDDGDSYVRAFIGEPLEMSIVKVPGFNQTTMEVAIAEAFNNKMKEEKTGKIKVDDKELHVSFSPSGKKALDDNGIEYININGKWYINKYNLEEALSFDVEQILARLQKDGVKLSDMIISKASQLLSQGMSQMAIVDFIEKNMNEAFKEYNIGQNVRTDSGVGVIIDRDTSGSMDYKIKQWRRQMKKV